MRSVRCAGCVLNRLGPGWPLALLVENQSSPARGRYKTHVSPIQRIPQMQDVSGNGDARHPQRGSRRALSAGRPRAASQCRRVAVGGHRHAAHRIPHVRSHPRAGGGRLAPFSWRPEREVRHVLVSPHFVAMLRDHIERYGVAPDGRLFRTSRGGLVQESGYGEVWARAREQALTPQQYGSPLAARHMIYVTRASRSG
jgi:hypothetical protein